MQSRQISVFVSSTAKDLSDYRAVARLAILDVGWVPVMMEHFGASPVATVEACRQEIERCDVVLLLVGFQRGWVPPKEQGGDGISSITRLELEHARARRLPVLVLMAAEESWPGNLWEREQAPREWVDEFRKGMGLPAAFFDHETAAAEESRRLPGFRAKVTTALNKQKERFATAQKPRAAEPDYFHSALMQLTKGDCVPFVGPAVYGEGPLSTPALVRELWPEAPGDQAVFATAAEFAERTSVDRERFLEQFANTLASQSERVAAPASFDLIAKLRLRAPNLVISATYDTKLEQHLLRAGRTCAVVCHVLRSYHGENNGKVLIVIPNGTWSICSPERLEIPSVDFIVYKPLGSPLLDRLCAAGTPFDPDLQLDTVVASETDHVAFLAGLEHQLNRVPDAFQRRLQRGPVLFLGLSLDAWHYRLVAQVFKAGSKTRAIAVRESTSTMERLAWDNLGVNLIGLDPNVFSERVTATLGPAEVVAHVG
jgi:hypothetical protein